MSVTTVELPSEVLAKLSERAIETGISENELAARAISVFLAQDPFEFVGSVSSDSLRARDADELLEAADFGR